MYSVAKETAMSGQNKLMNETMKNHFHLSGLQSWIILTLKSTKVMNWVLGIVHLKYYVHTIKYNTSTVA